MLTIIKAVSAQTKTEKCYLLYSWLARRAGVCFTKEETIKTLVGIVKDLAEEVGITQTISDYGARLEDLEMLSKKAMEDPCKPGNPREVDVEEFIKLYKKSKPDASNLLRCSPKTFTAVHIYNTTIDKIMQIKTWTKRSSIILFGGG